MVAKKYTVVQLLPNLEEGGVEGETVDLAIHLARNGHRSIVISGGGRLVRQIEEAGCIHILWKYIGEKSFRCLQYILKLKDFLVEQNVDVLHLRSRLPAWIGFWAWKMLPESARPSLVTSFHGFYSVNAYSSIMTKGQVVVAVSETISQHILQHYKIDPEKIRLIHGGFAIESFSPDRVSSARVEALRSAWLKGQKYDSTIILPGRLSHLKGQDILIEALSNIHDYNFICLLVGDTQENSSYTKKLREMIRVRGLEDKVLLVGHCSDMPAALMLADIVVSASSAQPEAFGKVAIEAMAMEKPVVATAHGGSLETIVDKKTGWLIPPLDPQALAVTLVKAMDSPEMCRQMGRAGRRYAVEHFTAQRMCEKTLEAYDELCRNRSKPSRLTVMQLLPELKSGGVERGTLEMGKYLAQHGHRSLVVSAGGRLVEDLEKEGSRHFPMAIGSKSPLVLSCLFPLRRLIKQQRVDVLHLRSRMPAWVGYIVWHSIRCEKRPLLITTFHGFYSVNAYSAIMTKSEGVIAVSKGIKEHIKEKYFREKNVQLIFRGVEIDSFDPDGVEDARCQALRQKWGIVDGVPLLMLPGRLTRLKGQEIFLKSLLLLKELSFQAVLVGDDGENRSYSMELLDIIQKNNLQDRVKLVGHCTDMPAAFLLADIVLSTSSLEPEAFGRTTVEAMAMGCPVIVTGHGGSLETVIPGENGWIVPPANVEELAGAIGEALSSTPERLREIGENNRRRVKENFTSQAMCEQTLSFYQKLLQERKRGR